MSDTETQTTEPQNTEPQTTETQNTEPKAAIDTEQKQAAIDTQKEAQEEYELTFGDDTVLDESDRERISEYVKKRGLSKEDAGEFVGLTEGIKERVANEAQEFLNKRTSEWAKSLETDSEIGGEYLEQSLKDARYAIDQYSKDPGSVLEILKTSGLRSHPEIVRMFARMGRDLKPKAEIAGTGRPMKQKSVGDILYGGSDAGSGASINN